MTKSKAARARARGRGGNGLSVPYGRMRPTTNWQIPTQQVTQTGQIVGGLTSPTSVPIWNPGSSAAPYQFANGVPQTFQLAVIQPGTTPNVPTIGRQRIDEVKGHLLVSFPSITGYYDVAFGIYVSEFTVNTSAWDVYDPMTPTDAARDDWWLLEATSFGFPTNSTIVAASESRIEVSLKAGVVIGAGQALHLSVTMTGPSTSTLFINPAVRCRVGPVA